MSARVALGLTLWPEPFSLEKSGNQIAKIAGRRSFGCLRPSTIKAKEACKRREQNKLRSLLKHSSEAQAKREFNLALGTQNNGLHLAEVTVVKVPGRCAELRGVSYVVEGCAELGVQPLGNLEVLATVKSRNLRAGPLKGSRGVFPGATYTPPTDGGSTKAVVSNQVLLAAVLAMPFS